MSESVWVYGINAVEGQLDSDSQRIIEVWVDQRSTNPRLREVVSKLEAQGFAIQRVSAASLERHVGQGRHQGIAIRCKSKSLFDETALPELAAAAGDKALFLILDQVQDPHNLGACIRSAAAVGATAVVFPKDRAAGITVVVERAAAGAVERMQLVAATNLARAIELLQKSGVWCYGLALEGKQSLYKLDMRGPIGLVMGAEGDGLRELTRKRCDDLIHIPMAGSVESLNVSVAAGICLFEAQRQRG